MSKAPPFKFDLNAEQIDTAIRAHALYMMRSNDLSELASKAQGCQYEVSLSQNEFGRVTGATVSFDGLMDKS